MNKFLATGLAESDLARLSALIERTATETGVVTCGTWSPTRQVVVVAACYAGQVLTWQVMPAASEAEGQSTAQRVFDVIADQLAQQVADAAVQKARLQ